MHGYIAYREDCVHANLDTDHALVLSLRVNTAVLTTNTGLTRKASMRADIFRRMSLTSSMSVFDSRTRLVVPRPSFDSTQVASRAKELRAGIKT